MRIVRRIEHDQNLFKILTDIYFNSNNTDESGKAAWILRHAVVRDPDRIQPYLKKLVRFLRTKPSHIALRRNGLGILQSVEVPESLYGLLSDICFKFLVSSNESVAVKVYSMSILEKIGNQIPEIHHELKLILQNLLPYGSAGFKARARKILSK